MRVAADPFPLILPFANAWGSSTLAEDRGVFDLPLKTGKGKAGAAMHLQGCRRPLPLDPLPLKTGKGKAGNGRRIPPQERGIRVAPAERAPGCPIRGMCVSLFGEGVRRRTATHVGAAAPPLLATHHLDMPTNRRLFRNDLSLSS